MRTTSAPLAVLALGLALGGSARAQLVGGSPYVGPSYGVYGQPWGVYTSVGMPGMGRGGPGVMLYFPSNGSSPFTPSPMDYSVAGLRLPVAGAPGSVYLPNGTVGGARPAGGGLGLPSPVPPPTGRATGPASGRPASTKKATAKADAAKADAAKAAPGAEADKAADDAPAAAPARSTLRERRGIR